MIEEKNSFDDLAAAYARHRVGYGAQLYEMLQELGFQAGWKVLDVACGTALASEPLAARGLHVTGVDPSEPMLEHARKALPDATFIAGRAEALPFADDSFDATICAQAMHWFDQAAAIAEMVRVVRPGGRIAIWWKQLTMLETIRAIRDEAAQAMGLTPTEDLMKGSFKAFYATPLADRAVRVIPFASAMTVERWMGYEASRARGREAYGDKLKGYLAELERRLRDKFGDASFIVNYSQFLYVGTVE